MHAAFICSGGWNDPRVSVWQPGKFAALVYQIAELDLHLPREE